VSSEAQADKIMRSRFSSVAKVALEKEHSPAAMSDQKLKKLQPIMVDRKMIQHKKEFSHALCG
jgi:hypothetical protein